MDATDKRARPVFAHSAAHVLGLALESEYGDGLLLSDGPPVNAGTVAFGRVHGALGGQV